MYFLYPLILFLIPVHAAFANNYMEIPKKDYIKTLVFMEIVVGLLFSGCLYLIKNPSLAALIFSLNFTYLLNANMFYFAMFSAYKRRQLKYFIYFSVISLFLCTLTSFFIYFLLSDRILESINKIFFWGSLVVTIFIIVDLFSRILQSNIKQEKKEKLVLKLKANKDLPDIYHIILDSHSGFSFKDLSDEYFKRELEKRGFKNYIDFKSNYKITAHSLPSIFNMDYIENFIDLSKSKKCLPHEGFPYYAHNEVFEVLNKNNYKFSIYTHPCFGYLIEKNKKEYDFGSEFVTGSNSIFKILYFNSFLAVLCTVFSILKIFVNTNSILSIFNAYEKGIQKKFEKPAYHYMHILAPHSPYLTDENGSLLNFECYGDDKYYLGYLKYIDKLVLKLIDKIKSEMKQNSLIIIHSDHNMQRDDKLSFNILMSLYLPDNSDYKIFDKIDSLVNLYRVIFSKYMGNDYKILENRYYYSNCGDFVLSEVTEEVKERFSR